MPHRFQHGPPKIALYALQAVLVGTPLFLGSVHPETLSAALGLLGITLFLVGWTVHKSGVRFGWPPFFWVLTAVFLLTTLYLLPIPLSWLAWFSPKSVSIWEQAFSLTESSETWVRLGHHFSQNVVELGRHLAIVGIFCLSYALTRFDARNGVILLHTVAWTTAAVVVIGALQTSLKTGFLFGLYTPVSPFADRGFYSTFVNENHLAGFLNLGALTALGQSFEGPSQKRRTLFALCYVAATAAMILTLSRGGLVAAVVATLAFGLIAIKNRSFRRRKRTFSIPFLLTTAVVLTTVSAFGYDYIVDLWKGWAPDVLIQDELKFRTIPDTVRMISDYWRAGVGPGSYGQLFSSYNTVSVNYIFTHPENFVLQLMADYGWIAAAALFFFGTVTLLRPLAAASNTPSGAGVICGLFALLLHNFVDFSFSIPGVVFPAIATLAVLIAEADSDRDKPRPTRIGALTLAVAVAAAAPVVLWADERFGDDAGNDLLRDQFEAAQPVTRTVSDQEKLLFWAQPADAHLYYLKSALSFRHNDLPQAQTWIEAALNRAPHQASLRLLAAKIALANNNRQDVTELIRDLLADDWSLFPNILKEFIPLFPDSKDSFGFLPQTDNSVAAASLQATISGKRRLAVQWLKLATDNHHDWYECHLQYGLRLAEHPDGQQLANAQATRLLGYFPDKPGGYLVQASIEEKAGRLAQALVLYRESQRLEKEPVDALLGEARVLVALGELREARLVLGRARSFVGTKKEQMGTLYEILSRASEREHRYDAAAVEMAIAVQMRPNDAAMWRRLSETRKKAGENTGAQAALRQAQILETQKE
ncbi:MAG: O-antigen ligase family protein [Myxococcales bacterium]|nr:O-antigen ligase family protein [Myxococcales bacterium]